MILVNMGIFLNMVELVILLVLMNLTILLHMEFLVFLVNLLVNLQIYDAMLTRREQT